MSITLTVPTRFRGPSNSANGGYAAGLLAAWIRGPAEITLLQPPPLDKPMRIEEGTPLRAYRKDMLILEGRPASLELEVPTPPDFPIARARTAHYVGHHQHAYPECFTCGPTREKGDGLRLFPGRVEPGEPVATHWVPHPSLTNGTATLAEPLIWAALDCPGYFAVAAPGEVALLGRMTAKILGRVRVNERCVVIGWSMGSEGRKRFAGTAVFGQKGRLVGMAKQTWITLA